MILAKRLFENHGWRPLYDKIPMVHQYHTSSMYMILILVWYTFSLEILRKSVHAQLVTTMGTGSFQGGRLIQMIRSEFETTSQLFY